MLPTCMVPASICLPPNQTISREVPVSYTHLISTSKVEELALELKDRYTIVIVTHNMQQARCV